MATVSDELSRRLRALGLASVVAILLAATSVSASGARRSPVAVAAACFKASHATVWRISPSELGVGLGRNTVWVWHLPDHKAARRFFARARAAGRADKRPLSLTGIHGKWVWTWQDRPTARQVKLVPRCLA